MKRQAALDLETLKSELEEEKDAIIRACAQFGIFLKNNSVLPYNDAMMAYLNLMIKRATEKGVRNNSTIHSLLYFPRLTVHKLLSSLFMSTFQKMCGI